MFCLSPQTVAEFKKKLDSGEMRPDLLHNMTSEQRNAKFAEFMGPEVAKKVNTLFESKVILKNQQKGFTDWVNQMKGLKPEAKRDMLSRIDRMETILSPANKKYFLRDLAEQRLGMGVTAQEAANITSLANKVKESKVGPEASKEAKTAHADAIIDFNEYMSNLRTETTNLKKSDFSLKNPGQAVKSVGKAIYRGVGLSKAVKFAFDNSALFRQGIWTLTDSPQARKIWLKNATESFKDFYRGMGNKDAAREIMRDFYTRDNYLNGNYKKWKIAPEMGTEFIPTSLPGKIPVLGRMFKGSEAAMEGFLTRTKADMADMFIKLKEQNPGLDIDGLSIFINSMLGKGDFGRHANIRDVGNTFLTSASFLKSQFDAMTAHSLDSRVGLDLKKRAGMNLAKHIGASMAILAIAKAIDPDSVDLDPRSGRFGKIKFGNFTIDVLPPGFGAMARLPATLLSQHYKDFKGNVRPLNTGNFGSKTWLSMVGDYFYNRTQPLLKAVLDKYGVGRDYDFKKPTLGSSLRTVAAPLPVENTAEYLNDENKMLGIAAIIAESLGFSIGHNN